MKRMISDSIISVFFHIFYYDLWFYFTHIVLHNKHFYTRIHKLHHLKDYQQLIYQDAFIGDTIENIVQPLGIFIPCFIYRRIYLSELVVAFIFVGVRSCARHDHRCSWLIGNHHLLHHKYPNYNYGEYWIDNIFGTTYPNESEYIYGLVHT